MLFRSPASPRKNSRVQISRARLEDSGNYTCVAENPLGKDNSTSAVHVQSSEYWATPTQCVCVCVTESDSDKAGFRGDRERSC